jgi:hypothetical protein
VVAGICCFLLGDKPKKVQHVSLIKTKQVVHKELTAKLLIKF